MVTFTTYCKVYNVRNLAVTDIVWLKDVCYQNQWSKTITADIDADAKNDVRSVTLPVADKKGGPSQILRRPIAKLVHNKNSKMNVILRGAR